MLRIRSNFIYIQSFHPSLYLRHYYPLLRYSHPHPSKKQNWTIRNIVSYLHLCLNSFLSPFEPISEYVCSRYTSRPSPKDPLFLTETGKVATRFCFNKNFYQILCISGQYPELYSIHYFCIGEATSAARCRINGYYKQTAPTSKTISKTSIKLKLTSVLLNFRGS